MKDISMVVLVVLLLLIGAVLEWREWNKEPEPRPEIIIKDYNGLGYTY